MQVDTPIIGYSSECEARNVEDVHEYKEILDLTWSWCNHQICVDLREV